MKKIFQLSLIALALLPALPAGAWTYNDGDVLLVFRESAIPSTYPSLHNDVEFDLGSVTNFLGKTNGYTTTVTGWNLSKVTNLLWFGFDRRKRGTHRGHESDQCEPDRVFQRGTAPGLLV